MSRTPSGSGSLYPHLPRDDDGDDIATLASKLSIGPAGNPARLAPVDALAPYPVFAPLDIHNTPTRTPRRAKATPERMTAPRAAQRRIPVAAVQLYPVSPSPSPRRPPARPSSAPIQSRRLLKAPTAPADNPEDSSEFVGRELARAFSTEGAAAPFALSSLKVPGFARGMGLTDYQALDFARIQAREGGEVVGGVEASTGYIVAYDMGLGKTTLSLAIICAGVARAKWDGAAPQLTLVLCPGPGVIENWRLEIYKFAPNLKFLQYHGKNISKGQGASAFKEYDVVLATYAQAGVQHTKYLTGIGDYALYDIVFHRVILDEAHDIRNPDTKHAEACWALSKKHGLCLTGTPAQNSARDFASYMKFLSVKNHRLNDTDAYDKLITSPIANADPGKATKLLVGVLLDYMIYRKSDLIQLPERHVHVVEIASTAAEREVYLFVKNMSMTLYAKFTRLRQVSTHPMHITKMIDSKEVPSQSKGDGIGGNAPTEQFKEDEAEALLPSEASSWPEQLRAVRDIFRSSYRSSKIRAVVRVLQTIGMKLLNEKTIVFAHFKLTLDLLQRDLNERGFCSVQYTGDMTPTQRDAALTKIRRDPQCTIVLMSIMAGAVGLNVSCCNNVILTEPWWNPYVEEQAISRAHRIGQTREVHVYKMVVRDTIEDRIVQLQATRRL